MKIFKRSLSCLLLLVAFVAAKAQTTEEVYDKYLDFNLARLQGEPAKAMELGESLLADTAKLAPKARINFYYSIGKIYEDDKQSIKAQQYYERVAVAVPDYYVVQRALGYIYAQKAEAIADQLNATQSNAQQNQKVMAAYVVAVRKALPHLEKAQACDPDDDTLNRIKLFYKNIRDQKGLDSLPTRLKALSKNCVDLLDDK